MALGELAQIKAFLKEAWEVTFKVGKFYAGLYVFERHLCTSTLTYGPSMLPTLNLTGDVVLAERISTRYGGVRRGDIVLAISPENPRRFVVKRLKGLEGDSVTYVVDPKDSDRCQTVVVPKGHVWIEGDNIYHTNDSRKYGAIPYGLLQGKVFWRIWPPKSFGAL